MRRVNLVTESEILAFARRKVCNKYVDNASRIVGELELGQDSIFFVEFIAVEADRKEYSCELFDLLCAACDHLQVDSLFIIKD